MGRVVAAARGPVRAAPSPPAGGGFRGQDHTVIVVDGRRRHGQIRSPGPTWGRGIRNRRMLSERMTPYQ